MNVTRLFSCIVCLIIAIVVGGCGDHRIPDVTPGSGSSKLRVKTITQDQPNNTAKASSFLYDAQGRLGKIITYQTPDSTQAQVENSVYQYDGQNRLTELKRDVVRRGEPFGTNTERYTYSYNLVGQIAALGYTNNNSSGGSWSVTPQYDGNNRVIGTAKSFNTGGLSTSEHSTFTYTGNNITFATTTGAIFRNITFPSETVNTTYTYDTGLNPFYGVFVIPAPTAFARIPGSIMTYYTYFGGFANLLNLNQNNVLTDGTNTYTYTYNSANLPTSRITTMGGSVTETLHYEYESY
ncbi:hypothetical protein [Spirosoma pollinicola]|uniref:DUF4595 domain-containing protein n=1 Tax=Spirosoma pollinicola TaxID=2057025 RepID=A0A2K8Z904_9BACT|nr:hypothetical protein [Spirosoma pollinicola]AUD06363.1 hypothetical protein CWM47_33705 [Spirosoma pollinicola]